MKSLIIYCERMDGRTDEGPHSVSMSGFGKLINETVCVNDGGSY